MANELATKPTMSMAIEQVMVEGDLSKLSPEQRVQYYKTTCESMGLNPYTRPFDYIRLNGKLTLYARKDAADQLRRINGVSIDEVSREITDGLIIVTVKGHDQTGRSDVEIGVVSKNDMQGNLANALMKANTKAKRRLTLSLCGLGWLDETEVESIPPSQVQPVIVDMNTGVIEGTTKSDARIEAKAVVVEEPINNTPVQENPVEEPQKPQFDEAEFLRNWRHRSGLPSMTLEDACQIQGSDKKEYGTKTTKDLFFMLNAIEKNIPTLTNPEAKDTYLMKLSAINEILTARKTAQEQLEKQGA